MGVTRRRRIRSGRDFREIYAQGGVVRNRQLVVYYRPSSRGVSRVGLSVGRRHGNAVRRNRIKRVLREVFRTATEHIPGELDIILIPRRGPQAEVYAANRDAFIHLMRKIAKTAAVT